MKEADDTLTKLAILNADIDRQRAIVADRRERGRPISDDEQLLAEMEAVAATLRDAAEHDDEQARLLALAAQCENQAEAAGQEDARIQLREMAKEYRRRASALASGL